MAKRNTNSKKRDFLHIFDDRFEFGDRIYYKKDIESYYRTHTDKECAKYLNIGLSTLKKILLCWKLKKTNEEIRKLTEKTLLKRYGNSHYCNSEKTKQTLINQFGSLETAYKYQSKLCRESKMKKYGNPNYNNMEKNKQTCLNKYGVENVYQSEQIKQKIRATSQKKYGVLWPSMSAITLTHAKETFLQKYGSESYLDSDEFKKFREEHIEEIKNKIRLAKEKILQDNPNFYKELAKKVCDSKRTNHTFNTSKSEETWYIKLCNKYGKDNVVRQYRDERYSYNCDFYISSEDLFIEINDYWTHGKHPYNENNVDDVMLLEELISKQSVNENGKLNSYYTAEYVWTVLDIKKFQCAIDNNLNYIAVYGDKFYNKYQKLIEFNIEDNKD